MTDGIAAFIKARLDEDEAAARATLSVTFGTSTDTYAADWVVEEGVDDTSIPEIGLLGGHTMTPGYVAPEHVRHIAAHDPARVLREVAADRELLAEYEAALRFQRRHERMATRMTAEIEYEQRVGHRSVTDPIEERVIGIARSEVEMKARLRLTGEWARRKAAIWADHPEYKAEWRP